MSSTLRLLAQGDPGLSSSTDQEVARAAVLAAQPPDRGAALDADGLGDDGLGDVEAARGRILAWLDAHPDALLRSCAAGHLTGSALVVDAEGRRVLLLHHRKLGRWLQPGGHADGEANLAATALREATEETGIEGLQVALPAIDLDVHRVEPPAEPPHLHLDVRYLVVAPPGAVVQGNHESSALRWVDPDDLDRFDVDDGLRRLVAAGLARLHG